jgi:bile acid-coenzyme A ligase
MAPGAEDPLQYPTQIPLETLAARRPFEPYVRTLARLARECPDAALLTVADGTITRGQFEDRTNQMARAYAGLGVGFGDFVTIGLTNSVEWFIHFVACWKVGATPQPVSPRLPAVERQAIVELANSKLVVGAVSDDHPGRLCVGADFTPPQGTSAEPLPEVVSPAWMAPTSGGSTGRPKLIVAGTGAEGSTAYYEWLFGYGADDRQIVAGPLFHNAPLAHAIGGLLLGHHIVILPRFDATELLDAVERHRITWLLVVPTMLLRLHRVLEDGPPRDLSSVRVLWHMASKCPDWLKEAWIQRMGPHRVFELYGGSESQALTVISGEEWLSHRGSVGRPVVGDMRIFDEAGEELPPGEIGEIYLRRTPGSAPTYRYIGASAKILNGWESLGDLGWADEDGYIYISDRRVDMIVSGGENIYPAEVEAVLESHPSVLSAVVVGLPDEELGARVHALVQLGEAVDGDHLLEFVAERLVRYKVPRSIEFIDSPLRDDAGKARRSAMRDEAIERMSKRGPSDTTVPVGSR